MPLKRRKDAKRKAKSNPSPIGAFKPLANTPPNDEAHEACLWEKGLIEGRSATKTIDGRTYATYEYNPNYPAKLPTGAIRGDITRQQYGMAGPQYYFKDRILRCKDCPPDSDIFVFSAKDQKFWYDTLGLYRDTIPLRCAEHRRSFRDLKATTKDYENFVRLAADQPDDPVSLIGLARATCAFYERTSKGNINRAVGAARRARQFESCPRGLFWEGKLQLYVDRIDKAAACLQDYWQNSQACMCAECTHLQKQAESMLEEIRPS